MEKVQSKLIQLSVEIEDKCKYIALLQDAIVQEGFKYEGEKQTLEDYYKKAFRDRSNEGKTRFSELIEKCKSRLEEKRGVTLKLNESLARKKKIKQECKKKIEKIDKEKQCEREKEKLQWKNEAKRRREKLLERKGKEIREITIKGLEPEIKQLVNKHETECCRIKAENEAAKQSMMISIQNEHTTKLKYAKENNDSWYSKSIDESRIVLRKKMDEENLRQAKTLAKIRDQFSKDVDSQRKWYKDELRKMAEFYASEIDSIKSTTEKRLLDIDDVFLSEKQQIICQRENEIQKFEAKAEDDDREWIGKIKNILGAERKEAISVEYKKIEKERDNILDVIIRNNQREISLLNESINDEHDNESESLRSMHEKAFVITSGSLDGWTQKHQLQQGEIYSIQTKKQNIREDLENKDASLREIKQKIKQLERTLETKKVTFESQVNQNESDSAMELMSVEEEINDLDKESNALDAETELKTRKYEQMKKDLEHAHNDKMEHLEQELKRAIDMNNAKRRDIMEQTKIEIEHIEHMRLIAKSYYRNNSSNSRKKT